MATVTITSENFALLTMENFSKLHSKTIRIIGTVSRNGQDFLLKHCGRMEELPPLKLDMSLLKEDICTETPIQVYGELALGEGGHLKLMAHFYRDFRNVNIGYYEAAVVSLQEQTWCPFLVPQNSDMDYYISKVTEQLCAQ